MQFKASGLIAALASIVLPATAEASSYFNFSVSALGKGYVQSYCTPDQGFSCADQRPIAKQINSPVFGAFIEEGLNKFDFGQHNAGGYYSFTIDRRGTSLYGRQISYVYQPCSAGRCDLTVVSAPSFTISASSGVPEPGTWMTMLLGFGAIGYAMRRKTVLRYV